MAHGDYECCAICDRKMGYHAFTEDHKTDVCPECREKEGVPATTLRFMALVEAASREELAVLLPRIGFEFCFYHNPVDDLIRVKLGIAPEKQFQSSREWLDLLLNHE